MTKTYHVLNYDNFEPNLQHLIYFSKYLWRTGIEKPIGLYLNYALTGVEEIDLIKENGHYPFSHLSPAPFLSLRLVRYLRRFISAYRPTVGGRME